MAQGDSELDGTGIETSITGDFKITLIKAADLEPWQQGLDFPMGETMTHWIVHSFTEIDYLETYAANPGDIYGASSIDDAMKNCYTQTRKFLMAKYGLTDAEAATFITVGVDFATTYSCMRGGDLHCGSCEQCNARRRAFVDAGLPEPAHFYSSPPRS